MTNKANLKPLFEMGVNVFFLSTVSYYVSSLQAKREVEQSIENLNLNLNRLHTVTTSCFFLT